MLWKKEYEYSIGVSYVKNRQSEKHQTGLSTTYYCRRSGVQRLSKNDSSRKRSTTTIGIHIFWLINCINTSVEYP